MARKMMYSFEEKKHSYDGIVSTIMGGISLIILIAMVYASYYNRGEAGLYIGAFGVTGLLFAIGGLIVGIKSFAEKNIKYRYCKLGSILCGVAFVIWLGLSLIGA